MKRDVTFKLDYKTFRGSDGLEYCVKKNKVEVYFAGWRTHEDIKKEADMYNRILAIMDKLQKTEAGDE